MRHVVALPVPSSGPGCAPSRSRYVIFYTVDGDDVRVERILHGSRDIQGIFDEGKMPKDG